MDCPTRAILSYIDPSFQLPELNTIGRNALCHHCASLSAALISSAAGQPHADSIGSLQRSARVCPLCNLLYLNSFGGIRSRQDLPTGGPVVCYLRFNGAVSFLDLAVPGPSKQTKSGSVQLRVYTKEGDPAQHCGVNVLRPLTETCSQRSVQLARKWIDDCKQHHDCGQLLRGDRAPSFRPTRLIDVGRPDRNSKGDLRLTSGTNVVEYVTLSYCWGAHVQTQWRTTIENMDSRYIGFDTRDLPKTLRDAITVTQNLGFSYLWIDALCIVQDSQRDWEEQSMEMGLIYGNSSVTIAAASSAGAENGIFNSRSVSQSQILSPNISISTYTSEGRLSTLFAFQWRDHQGSRESEESPQQLRDGPLVHRGWAYQERLFSPRTLHYTSEQLFWECRECYLAEDSLYTQPYARGTIQGYTVSGRLRNLRHRTPEQVVFETLFQWYTYIIPAYTERLLSRSKDRLPAVSAIAKAIHETTGAEYHAGLWLHTSQYGLGWQVTEPATKPAEYRAPSYSWASLDAKVDWPVPIFGCDTPPIADFLVLSHETSSSSHDLFGTVEAAHLDLYGQLKSAVTVPIASDTADDSNYENGELWEYGEGGRRMTRIEGRYPPKVILDEPKIGCHIEVKCFLLCSEQPEQPGDRYWESWMLLLQPTGTKNTYRRVGVAALADYRRAGWFDDSYRQRVRLV